MGPEESGRKRGRARDPVLEKVDRIRRAVTFWNLGWGYLWVVLVAGLGGLYLLAPRLFQLSALMVKVDLLAFGGGYASVPLMHHEVVAGLGWMDGKTFMDGIAMGQVTPGPIVEAKARAAKPSIVALTASRV